MATKEMQVVKGLEIEKCMGRWYEIASFPSRFQPKGGADTRATYTLNPDGTVHVLNETWTDGKRGSIEGTAWKVDANSDEAKLKILSRQSHIDEGTYNELVGKASEQGYDVSKLQRTSQSETPPGSEETPEDKKGIWWIKSIILLMRVLFFSD